jgi:hypothetical protein
MKGLSNSFRNQQKQNKLLLRKLDSNDKQYKLKKDNMQRLRMVQSVKNAGHVRGGHAFH